MPRPSTPFDQALLLAGLTAAVRVFAMLRAPVQRLLTRLVFRPARSRGADRRSENCQSARSRSICRGRPADLGEFMGADAPYVDDAPAVTHWICAGPR